MLHDPSYWSDPQTLKPERFLDDDGKVQKDERWIPFGMGEYFNKLICVYFVQLPTCTKICRDM